MTDPDINPPSDIPRVINWDYPVSGDNPTPLFCIGGGIIITGPNELSFCLGLSGSEMRDFGPNNSNQNTCNR
jgi:hypothetical protein